MEDLLNWPRTIVADLVRDPVRGPIRASRLRMQVERGFDVHTQYSGIDGPRECCHRLGLEIGADSAWRFLSAADRLRKSRAFIMGLNASCGDTHSCVFGSFDERIAPAAALQLQTLLDGLEGKHGADKELAILDIARWLAEDRQAIFPSGQTAACYAHGGGQCLAAPPSSTSRARWSIAGFTCTAYSRAGKQNRGADRSEVDRAIWMAERMALADRGEEAGFLAECVTHFPTGEMLRDPMASTHDIVWVHTGPREMGFPAERPRMFAAGIAKCPSREGDQLVWCGPEDQAEVQREFDTIFNKRVVLDGSIFFQAPAHVRDESYRAKLALRGSFPAPECDLSTDPEIFDMLLPPGAAQRLESFMQLGGSCICDVEHWPRRGYDKLSRTFPIQLTHGTIVDIRTNGRHTLALGTEHLCAQGFPMFPVTGSPSLSLLSPHLASLPEVDQKFFSGNGIFIPAFSAWMLYVWSNLTCVRSIVFRPLGIPEPDDLDHEHEL